MASVNSVFSFKVLSAITAAVLAVHLAALQVSPTVLRPRQAEQPPHTFMTRSIEPVATPLAAPPVIGSVAATAPLDRRTRSARTRPPPAADAAPGPVAAEQAASSRAQDATAPDPAGMSAEHLALAPGQAPPPQEPTLAVVADKLPRPVRLKYRVLANKFPYRLDAELLWQQTGEQYEAQLEISAFGQTRVQTSRGQITPQGLAPLRFSDKFRSEVAAHFNRAQGKVTFSANTPDVALLAGAQDRLSVLVQLAAMLASAPQRYPQASTITIQTIGPRAADSWRFTVGEPETLALPGGQQATLKLVRNPREAFDQKVELWLAPALGYLPARIRITEANGDFVDQQWLASEPKI
ncbi:DUF3108 domain-containing protein [Rhodoferax sp.]|uniref:DUF3108 domain-containing protein n=1 Tax=Rhodoferax sp. TaxID=50421 RepID=UPI00374D4504